MMTRNRDNKHEFNLLQENITKTMMNVVLFLMLATLIPQAYAFIGNCYETDCECYRALISELRAGCTQAHCGSTIKCSLLGYGVALEDSCSGSNDRLKYPVWGLCISLVVSLISNM